MTRGFVNKSSFFCHGLIHLANESIYQIAESLIRISASEIELLIFKKLISSKKQEIDSNLIFSTFFRILADSANLEFLLAEIVEIFVAGRGCSWGLNSLSSVSRIFLPSFLELLEEFSCRKARKWAATYTTLPVLLVRSATSSNLFFFLKIFSIFKVAKKK